jgi:hypothetical protein
MSIHLPRSRRLANRRVWALHVLSVHVENGGACDFCVSTYGADHPWPCLPARIAMLYIGHPSIGHPSIKTGGVTDD